MSNVRYLSLWVDKTLFQFSFYVVKYSVGAEKGTP